MNIRLATIILLLTTSLLRSESQSVRIAFEVATIKPDNAPVGPSRIVCHAIDSGMAPGTTPPLGRCQATRLTLYSLISTAYGVGLPTISGGPDWIGKERFDIEAKAEDPSTTTRDQFRLMIQTLLTDRFKLKFHRQVVEGNGYELLVGKTGPRFEKTKGGNDRQGVGVSGTPEGQLMTGFSATMERLANVLAGRLEVPVLDQTGLAGMYDFSMKWTPGEGETGFRPGLPQGVSLFTAIQEQLGLRLESKKLPIEMTIIDSAEKPVPDN
jgi:uncharacterized protein (TIGR03435 family)